MPWRTRTQRPKPVSIEFPRVQTKEWPPGELYAYDSPSVGANGCGLCFYAERFTPAGVKVKRGARLKGNEWLAVGGAICKDRVPTRVPDTNTRHGSPKNVRFYGFRKFFARTQPRFPSLGQSYLVFLRCVVAHRTCRSVFPERRSLSRHHRRSNRKTDWPQGHAGQDSGAIVPRSWRDRRRIAHRQPLRIP